MSNVIYEDEPLQGQSELNIIQEPESEAGQAAPAIPSASQRMEPESGYRLPDDLEIETETDLSVLDASVDVNAMDELLSGPVPVAVLSGFAICTVLFLIMFGISKALRLFDIDK